MTKRRPTPTTRRLLASALPAAAVLAPAGAGLADPGIVLNRYALPGAIDTPSAEMMPDGTLGAVLGYSGVGGNGVGVSFQVLPRVSAVEQFFAEVAAGLWDKQNKEALDWAIEETGQEILSLSDEETLLWIEKVEPIQQDFIERMNSQGRPGEEILEVVKAQAAKQ